MKPGLKRGVAHQTEYSCAKNEHIKKDKTALALSLDAQNMPNDLLS